MSSRKPILYVIPVCPFCQRVEILLALKGATNLVEISVVDASKPRSAEHLKKTGGYEALPVLETSDGKIIKESMVILEYLDKLFPTNQIKRKDPYQGAVENMLVALGGDFIGQGYGTMMNRDKEKQSAQNEAMLEQYAVLNAFLLRHSPQSKSGFLFDGEPGWVEATIAPFFQRWWFLEYYCGFQVPKEDPKYSRVFQWAEACKNHPAFQQVTFEHVVKLYYDYAWGFGNSALPPNRKYSTFSMDTDWRNRPMPPQDKWDNPATDEQLGLVPH